MPKWCHWPPASPTIRNQPVYQISIILNKLIRWAIETELPEDANCIQLLNQPTTLKERINNLFFENAGLVDKAATSTLSNARHISSD